MPAQEDMLGLWLEDCRIDVRRVPLPAREDEALVRVRLAGVCGTDLHMIRGYYPFTGVFGHEFVGEVVRSPKEPELEGQRVVGEINANCGSCPRCLEGSPTHCENRTVLGILGRDGAFAEFLTLPVANLHTIPSSTPDEAAVFVEPLAASLEILEQVHLLPTHRVLVVGAGRMGQIIARVLALTGCELSVLARHEHQRNLLENQAIASEGSGQEQERAYDIVVDASGSPSGFETSLKAVKPRGTVVMKSTYPGEQSVNLSKIVVDEISLVGSRCGPFPPAIRLLDRGRIDLADLITARYPLDEGRKAIEHAGERGVLKVLIEP